MAIRCCRQLRGQPFFEPLLPLAHVVTPNLHEAGVLCGFPVEDLESMKDAAMYWSRGAIQWGSGSGGWTRPRQSLCQVNFHDVKMSAGKWEKIFLLQMVIYKVPGLQNRDVLVTRDI